MGYTFTMKIALLHFHDRKMTNFLRFTYNVGIRVCKSLKMKGCEQMEIERINDHTIKFFVPFQDVETRGFSKEEVLFQPERGEELFWEIMEEINQGEEYELESPLWIQVHVTDLGLEVIAVGIRALNGEAFESLSSGPFEGTILEQLEKILEQLQIDEKGALKALVNRREESNINGAEADKTDEIRVFSFAAFEDIIQLSAYEQQMPEIDGIYVLEGKYYIGVCLDALEGDELKNVRGLLMEFGDVSPIGWVRIQTYGKCLGKSDGLTKIRQAFWG